MPGRRHAPTSVPILGTVSVAATPVEELPRSAYRSPTNLPIGTRVAMSTVVKNRPRRSHRFGFTLHLTSGALVVMLATGCGLSAAAQPAPLVQSPLHGLRAAPSWVVERMSLAAPDLYFDAGSHVLRARERRKLDDIAPALEALLYDFPNLIIVIEGYADDRGLIEYNDRLAWERAEGVRRVLLNFSFPQDHLRTVSFCYRAPQCSASDERLSRRNRRVHFRAARETAPAGGGN